MLFVPPALVEKTTSMVNLLVFPRSPLFVFLETSWPLLRGLLVSWLTLEPCVVTSSNDQTVLVLECSSAEVTSAISLTS